MTIIGSHLNRKEVARGHGINNIIKPSLTPVRVKESDVSGRFHLLGQTVIDLLLTSVIGSWLVVTNHIEMYFVIVEIFLYYCFFCCCNH